jgi:hypothetical protein
MLAADLHDAVWRSKTVDGAEPMTTGALVTIGYEGRTQHEYLGLLRDAGVTHVESEFESIASRRTVSSRAKGTPRKVRA